MKNKNKKEDYLMFFKKEKEFIHIDEKINLFTNGNLKKAYILAKMELSNKIDFQSKMRLKHLKAEYFFFTVGKKFSYKNLKFYKRGEDTVLYLGEDNDFNYYLNLRLKKISVIKGNLSRECKPTKKDLYSLILIGYHLMFDNDEKAKFITLINEISKKYNFTESDISSLNNKLRILFTQRKEEKIEAKRVVKEKMEEIQLKVNEMTPEKVTIKEEKPKQLPFTLKNGVLILKEAVLSLMDIKNIYRENGITFIKDNDGLTIKENLSEDEFQLLKKEFVLYKTNIF